MASNTKKSNQKIAIIEQHVAKGLEQGIEAAKKETNSDVIIPEIIDILTKFAYDYNKMLLNYTNQGDNADNTNLKKEE